MPLLFHHHRNPSHSIAQSFSQPASQPTPHQCSSVWRITGDTLASSHRLLLLRHQANAGGMSCSSSSRHIAPGTSMHMPHGMAATAQPSRLLTATLLPPCQLPEHHRRSPDHFVDKSSHPPPLVSHHALPPADLAGIVSRAAACKRRHALGWIAMRCGGEHTKTPVSPHHAS